MKAIFVMLLFFVSQANAKDFGLYGADFEVSEPSMLTEITDKVKALSDSGQLEEINKDFIKRVKSHILEPKSTGLSRAKKTISYLYYPSVTLQADILDANNHVLIAKGSYINALDKMPGYFPYWIFVDGRDAAQLNWVKKELQNRAKYKIILTGGNIKEVSEFFQGRVYFDQEGRLTQKLGVTHVPAVVERKNNALLITEHKIVGVNHA